jgi:hypothetical protein
MNDMKNTFLHQIRKNSNPKHLIILAMVYLVLLFRLFGLLIATP